jgi:hypothetical protein
MTTAFIGQPVSRVDGRQKVTGAATYAAEFEVANLAHAAVVRSTVANGRIASIDRAAAERAPGVLAVLTYRNAPRLAYRPHKGAPDPGIGERLHVLQDDRANHQGHPIALVIADTLEQAVHAATLVHVTYASESATTDIGHAELADPSHEEGQQGEVRPDESRRGDPDGALAAAEVTVDQTYVIPREAHNPIEMHATIASWDGDHLTLWDKTQWVHNTADEIAAVFGLPAENIRVISPFVGGAFGSGLRTWPHVTLAALGARVAGRPVKLMLTRHGMYYGVGYRPHTVQRVALGASRDGRLTAVLHEGHQETSVYEEFTERLLDASRFLYSCPERLHAPSARAHERAHADLHARAWRGERSLRPRMRHGRARRGAEYRSGRPAPAQRAGQGRVQWPALLKPLDTGMLPARRRALRLEPTQPDAWLDTRRTVADRLGHGERHLPRVLCACFRPGASPAGRHRRGRERCERHGSGYLDLHDAGGGPGSRPADRAGEVYSSRLRKKVAHWG